MRWLPKKAPGPAPMGIDTCEEEALWLWADFEFCMAPSQFRTKNLCLRPDGSRTPPNTQERERLLRFPKHYLLAATPSSWDKSNKWAVQVQKNSLLGNTMDCLVVAKLLGDLAFELGYLSYPPTIEEIREGKVAHLHVNASSAVGRPRHQRSQLPPEEALIWWLMSRSDHRGSDVRLTTGEIMKPSRISRQGVDSTGGTGRAS